MAARADSEPGGGSSLAATHARRHQQLNAAADNSETTATCCILTYYHDGHLLRGLLVIDPRAASPCTHPAGGQCCIQPVLGAPGSQSGPHTRCVLQLND
jgi:hypothetical protein